MVAGEFSKYVLSWWLTHRKIISHLVFGSKPSEVYICRKHLASWDNSTWSSGSICSILSLQHKGKQNLPPMKWIVCQLQILCKPQAPLSLTPTDKLASFMCVRWFESKALPSILHHVSRAAGWLDRSKVASWLWCKIQEEGQLCEEKKNTGKRVGTVCPRVFLQMPACLTHSCYQRGPMRVLASSGLAHDGNTKETDWKWNTFLGIKKRNPGIWNICILWLFVQMSFEWKQAEGPSLLFLDESLCSAYSPSLWCVTCSSPIITAAHVASVVCVDVDPDQLDGTHRGTV